MKIIWKNWRGEENVAETTYYSDAKPSEAENWKSEFQTK